MQHSRPILLIEDNDVDIMTIECALTDLRITNQLIQKSTSKEALEYLKNPENIKPGLIFLDLNLPKTGGIEFIKIIKADDVLKTIPVIVLTVSTEDKDIVESFKLSVAGYMVKPAEYEEVVEASKIINDYWAMSQLPNIE